MTRFLNLNIDSGFNKKHLTKHILFSTFWILGFLIFIFRIDPLLIEHIVPSATWLTLVVPIIYIIILFSILRSFKWYYSLGYIFYPFLLFFWFIPKIILSKGKVYLFVTYLSGIARLIVNYKHTIFNFFLLFFSLILFVIIRADWSRIIMVFVMLYFYMLYIYRILKNAFSESFFFNTELEKKINLLVENNSSKNSLVISAYINRKDDEKVEREERRLLQLRRAVFANYVIELMTSKLQSIKRRRPFLKLFLLTCFTLFIVSVFFYWFINFQLYKIANSNFLYNGKIPLFDFLYYTLKTITFSDIDSVKPVSILAKSTEILSFLSIGIFILVLVFSIFLSIKQEKINENLQLATDLFKSEKLNLMQYFKDEYDTEIKSAVKEVKNIDESLKKLKKIIDKFF